MAIGNSCVTAPWRRNGVHVVSRLPPWVGVETRLFEASGDTLDNAQPEVRSAAQPNFPVGRGHSAVNGLD
jgi:hypothetical protein